MNFGIYCRRSYYSDKSDSVSMQESQCRAHIDRVFTGQIDSITPYVDDGFLRSDIDRPSMNRLREDVLAGDIDCVVIYKIDRVGSNMMDFCTFYTFLKEHNVKFITVTEGIDTNTPLGEAMMYLAVIFSNIEISNDTLRITDNMRHLASSGYWAGGSAPFGYQIAPISDGKKTHKTLVPDASELKFKQMLIDVMLDNNYSLQQMETYCKNNHLRTVTGHVMSTTVLYQIITNPMHVADTVAMYDYFSEKGCIMDDACPRELWDGKHGIIVYGRTAEKRINGKKRHVKSPAADWRVSIGKHEPTMTDEMYFKIMGQFKNKAFDKKMKHETTLLKGVLRCKCGRLMSLARKPRQNGMSTWYNCPRRNRYGREYCNTPAIKSDILDNKVISIFKSIDVDPDIIDKYMDKPVQNIENADAILSSIKANDARIERLTESLSTNPDSGAAKYIVAQIEKLDIEQGNLRRKLTECSQAKRLQDNAQKSAKQKRKEISQMIKNFDALTPTEKNAIARDVIKSATWDGETLFLSL